MTTQSKPPNKDDVTSRLKRFRFQIMELEFGQTEFSDLRETKFYELYQTFCVETYHARCALQKLQSKISDSTDKRWFEG